jgi:quinol monooxygenase YgiN
MSQFEVRARLKVRDGQLEGFKRQAAEMMRQTREKDTGTLAYDWFLSEDGTTCEVREAYVDADALVEHAINVREAREAMFAEFADDHKMAFYGDPSPRLVELVNRAGVDVTSFTLLQALDPASVH